MAGLLLDDLWWRLRVDGVCIWSVAAVQDVGDLLRLTHETALSLLMHWSVCVCVRERGCTSVCV